LNRLGRKRAGENTPEVRKKWRNYPLGGEGDEESVKGGRKGKWKGDCREGKMKTRGEEKCLTGDRTKSHSH